MRIDDRALHRGYEKLVLRGAGFDHVAYFKPGKPNSALHVYIEHDGTPWLTKTVPAADPTPTNPLALDLMAQDDAPALYLGRPCYFGQARQAPCEPVWWTHWRFSRRVIDSMNAALDGYLASHAEYKSLTFVGYSGGGVVATLMVRDFPQTVRLVTLAAPLDVGQWASLHGYSRLEGSIDPLNEPPLPQSVVQLHYVGEADDMVPISVIQPFLDRQPSAELHTIALFTHYCCWASIWKGEILLPQ